MACQETVPLTWTTCKRFRRGEWGRLLPRYLPIKWSKFARRSCSPLVLATRHLTGPRNVEDAASLSAAYQVLEWLAASHDPDVINAVVVEIFENLDGEPQVLEAIKAHFGKASGQLYNKWLG